MEKNMKRGIAFILTAVLLLTGCGGTSTPAGTQGKAESGSDAGSGSDTGNRGDAGSGRGVGRSDTALHKDVSGSVKWEKGVQINCPDETKIRRWLKDVL